MTASFYHCIIAFTNITITTSKFFIKEPNFHRIHSKYYFNKS